MRFRPALEITQFSCGVTCFGLLSFNFPPPVLVGLTCGNWPWDCVVVGLGVFSWFLGTCSSLGLLRVEGEIGMESAAEKHLHIAE